MQWAVKFDGAAITGSADRHGLEIALIEIVENKL